MQRSRFFIARDIQNEDRVPTGTTTGKLDFIISELKEQKRKIKYLQEQQDQVLSLVDQTAQ